MVNQTAFPASTAQRLQDQWRNPSDIFTILMIIGGDIVRVSIAQLCAGPVPYLTPVSFSFGWVNYAISAMLSAIGDNRLMPKPEVACMVINAKSGYRRNNNSWILSRMLRDFDYWKPAICDKIEAQKLEELRQQNDCARREHLQACKLGLSPKHSELPETKDIRIGLRVTVWRCITANGKGSGDFVYWIGLLVTAIQLCIATIPWGLYGEWFSFLVIAGGTVLAYASSALPNWRHEKIGVRDLAYVKRKMERKDVILTEGNGTHDVLLILGCDGGMDLEALASAQRELPHAQSTRILSITLAALWIVLLVTVSGWTQNTWYIVGVGMIGMLHNVGVAGMKRQPKAWGIDLAYEETIVSAKVMDVLRLMEESYPQAGAALTEEFFPGRMFSREKLLWEYADRRARAWKQETQKRAPAKIHAWPMPPLLRPDEQDNDRDIPADGPYMSGQLGAASVGARHKDEIRHHIVDIDT